MKQWSFLLLPLLLFGACSLFDDDDSLLDVERHWRAWERLGIDTYEYDLTVSCFCPYVGPVRLQVRADTVFSATVLDTEQPFGPEYARTMTLDELYGIVLEAVVEEAHKVEIDYDETYDFPTRVDIDYIEDAVDDEVRYTAENFRPLRLP